MFAGGFSWWFCLLFCIALVFSRRPYYNDVILHEIYKLYILFVTFSVKLSSGGFEACMMYANGMEMHTVWR